MAEYGFNLLWSDEDQGFIATCPDFPGLSAFGETPEEALVEAKIALDLFTESLQASGHVHPKPTQTADYSGQVRLRMPKSLHFSLVQKASQEGVSLNTWLVTLLSERNATFKIAEDVCNKIENVERAIHISKPDKHRVRIDQNVTYFSESIEGDDYGTIEPVIN